MVISHCNNHHLDVTWGATPANVAAAVLWFTLTLPAFFFAFYRFKQHETKYYFHRRHPELIQLQIYNFLIFVIGVWSVCILGSITSHKFTTTPTIQAVRLAISFTQILVWIAIMIIRVYLLRFDMKLHEAKLNLEWQQHLLNGGQLSMHDQEEEAQSNHRTRSSSEWFLEKFDANGNSWWHVRRIGLAVLVAFTSIVAVLHAKKGWEGVWIVYAIDLGFMILAVALLWINWRKFPAFHDFVFLQKELSLSLICFGIFCAAFPIVVWLRTCYVNYSLLIWTIYQSVVVTCSMFMMTLFVITKNEDLCSRCREWRESEQAPSPKRVTWKNFILKPHGYEAFALFLVREFAVENLLYITELMQMKQQCKSELDEMLAQAKSNYSPLNIEIPPSVPDGANCICRLVCPMSVHTMGFYLYKKYVCAQDAPYEINIAFETREGLREIFDTFTECPSLLNVESVSQSDEVVAKEIHACLTSGHTGFNSRALDSIVSFDMAARQVSRLLTDSFSRFTLTKEFWKVENSAA